MDRVSTGQLTILINFDIFLIAFESHSIMKKHVLLRGIVLNELLRILRSAVLCEFSFILMNV